MPELFDTREIWTPDGINKEAPSIGGRSLETGGDIMVHRFKIHSAKYNKTTVILIPGAADMSRAEIEDIIAQAQERCLIEWEEERQRKVGKHTPSKEERFEVGAALREIRAHKKLRQESTNGQILYPVVKVGK